MNEMIMVSHSLHARVFVKYNFVGQSDPPESPQILDIYSVVIL